MLYAVANEGWTPGCPLEASETRSGMYRTRLEVGAIAAGRRLLALSVRYDPTRGVITPTPPSGREVLPGWSAPAIVGLSGGVTALAEIPASLVQLVGPSRLRLHPGHPAPGRPHSPNRTVAEVPPGR